MVLFETPSPADPSVNILSGKIVTTNFNNDTTSVSGNLDLFFPGYAEDLSTGVQTKRLLCSHDVAGVTNSKNLFQDILIKNRLCLCILPEKVHNRRHSNRLVNRYNH